MQIIILGKPASGKTLLARALRSTVESFMLSELNLAKTELITIDSTNTDGLIRSDLERECTVRLEQLIKPIPIEPIAQPASTDLRQYLGKKATDKITGFTGIVTGFATYITGCDQVSVLGKSVDNKPADCLWLDINRVEFTDIEPLKIDTSVDKGACEAPSKY